MLLVIIESPYAGHVDKNILYARACLADSIRRGEAPFASHLLYTQEGVLRDAVAGERTHGMEAGFAWAAKADLTAVYTDLGISAGMLEGVARARRAGRPTELRGIVDWPKGLSVRITHFTPQR